MSQVLWCDLGDHPYPAGQKGSTQISVGQYVKNQWGGDQLSQTVQDVCAACARDQGLRNLRKADLSQEEVDMKADEIRAATTSRFKLPRSQKAVSAKVADPDKIAALEREEILDRIAALERE